MSQVTAQGCADLQFFRSVGLNWLNTLALFASAITAVILMFKTAFSILDWGTAFA